ncbi:MAG: protein kinase domain-containing protein [Ktedonobacteraceae bacterium]
MTNRVGQRLGNYHLIELLGEGGFAEVYLGEHIHLGTKAAIKVLRTQLTVEDVNTFRNEARTIAQLEHPHIIRVLEFGVEERTPFLVMSYANNGTMRRLHPKGSQVPLQAVVSYVKQVADALQYAHDEKVIHRDVKPENMLVGKRREILLSDFGIAVMAQSSRYQNAQDMAGTIAYMAPEQIQGKPQPASDQYSLGIVIYEWLTGTRPFHGSLTEIVTQHISAPPKPLREFLPNLSTGVEEVVMKALTKDPKERFVNVKDMAEALEKASQPQKAFVDLITQAPAITDVQKQASLASNQVFTTPNQSLPFERLSNTQQSNEGSLVEALKFLEKGLYKEALSTLNHFLRIAPNIAYVHNAKGLTLYHLNRYSEALTSLDRAISLDPKDTTTHFGRGLVLERLHRSDDALAAFKQATLLDANYIIAWRKIGDMLAELKSYEEALVAYDKALQLDSKYPEAYIGKGNVLKQLGRLK